jgi:hypothetical protein
LGLAGAVFWFGARSVCGAIAAGAASTGVAGATPAGGGGAVGAFTLFCATALVASIIPKINQPFVFMIL